MMFSAIPRCKKTRHGRVPGLVCPFAIRLLALGVCLAILAGFAPQAQAFFVFGGTDPFRQRIQFIRWPFFIFDTNEDGDVSDPNDGIFYYFETGDGGWTREEMNILREAFQVWQDVPTAYAAFRGFEEIDNVVELDFGTSLDGKNVVAVATDEDVANPNYYQLPAGVLGITLISFTVEDTTVVLEPDGIEYPISAGRIFEVDLLIDGAVHRPGPNGEQPEYDLIETAVHEIGHSLGLAHNPMNNFFQSQLRDDPDGSLGLDNVESAVYAQRDSGGRLVKVGVTPTMYPNPFLVDDGQGNRRGGMRDLAPDDIAGLSFLYPREDYDDVFFNIVQEARTGSAPGMPTRPLLGALITAYCDVDGTGRDRVPFMSTMTGLYITPDMEDDRGIFDMRGLRKQIETINGGLIDATYTMVMTSLDPANTELNDTGQPPENFDSTHLGTIEGNLSPNPIATWGLAYDLQLNTEVYNETGNLLTIDDIDNGTPLMYDQARGAVVSADTGDTLAEQLPQRPGNEVPMFGDAGQVCPLNVAYAGVATSNVPNALRTMRDNVLVQTAAGAMVVDAYYRIAPACAGFLLKHAAARKAAATAAGCAEWAWGNPLALLLAVVALSAVAWAWRKRRARTLAAMLIIALALALAVMPASAKRAMLSTPEAVALSDDIVVGKVVSVSSRQVEATGAIVTDVTVEVEDTVKGRANKGGAVHLTVPGGRVGAIATLATDMPRFAEGEEVVLMLEYRPAAGHLVVGGERGKYAVQTDEDTGQKYVRSAMADAQDGLKSTSGKARAEGKGVALEDFKVYLGEIMEQQKK